VVVVGARHVAGDDLEAAVGRVRGALALLAVRVADVVRVLLVELVGRDDALGELAPPELQALLQRQADALQEEDVLQAAVVLEVVVGLERLVQVAHAHRHGLEAERVQALGRDVLLGLGVGEVLAGVALAHYPEQLGQARVVLEVFGELAQHLKFEAGSISSLTKRTIPMPRALPTGSWTGAS